MSSKGKNYYRVLGVSPQEGEAGIRKAYREKAKKHHPDRAGQDSTARFQEISEAYEVLSSSEKRREYDRALVAERRAGRRPVSGSQRSVRPEPLVPRQRPRGPGFRSPAEDIFSRFDRRISPEDRDPRISDFEIYLDRRDAVPGASVQIDLPASAACRFCGGSGRDWLFPCLACLGSGSEISSVRMALRLPEGLQEGSVIEIPAARGLFGCGTIRLTFHVE